MKGLRKGPLGGCWQVIPAPPPAHCHWCCKAPNGLMLQNTLAAVPRSVLAALPDMVQSPSCHGHGQSHGCF